MLHAPKLSVQFKDPLKNIPIWRDVSARARQNLMSIGAIETIKKGAPSQNRIGIVIDGVLGMRRQLNDDRWTYCNLLHGGNFYDFRRSDRRRQGEWTALKSATTLTLLETFVDDIVDPELKRVFKTLDLDQSGQLRDHAVDIALKTPIELIASVLFEFKRWPETQALKDPSRVILPITRVDLAHYLGIKPETVSRAFGTLVDKRLIKFLRLDEVKLNAIPELRQIANGGCSRGGA